MNRPKPLKGINTESPGTIRPNRTSKWTHINPSHNLLSINEPTWSFQKNFFLISANFLKSIPRRTFSGFTKLNPQWSLSFTQHHNEPTQNCQRTLFLYNKPKTEHQKWTLKATCSSNIKMKPYRTRFLYQNQNWTLSDPTQISFLQTTPKWTPHRTFPVPSSSINT